MSAEVQEHLPRFLRGESLSIEESAAAIEAIVTEALPIDLAAAWLALLAAKGASVQEVFGAALALRAHAVPFEHRLPFVLDVCGTGGDGRGTINISTIVAFIVAACGMPVAKHGNRSASSRCGSADVLEELGLPIELSPQHAAESLEHEHFAFLFARQYHPALSHVAALRRRLAIPTIFNLLGPLLNPARPTHQLIGVSSERSLALIADVAPRLGVTRGVVVYADSGLDEVAGEGMTTLLRFDADGSTRIRLDPTTYGVAASLDELAGGDAAENAAALIAILEGEESPRAAVVALNAAVALWVAERAESLEMGFDMAQTVLRTGAAREVLRRMQRIDPRSVAR